VIFKVKSRHCLNISRVYHRLNVVLFIVHLQKYLVYKKESMGDQILINYYPLIQDAIDNFEIAGDLNTWDRTEAEITRLEERRNARLEETRESLRSLSRKLEIARSSAQLSPTHRDTAQRLTQLDKEKFALVKSINELESVQTPGQVVLEELQNELETLNSTQLNRAQINDSDVLKLQIYRNLGFDFIDDNSKVLIQSTSNRNVEVFPLAETNSKYVTANYLWEKI
jgi:Spc24 subunit of Ndc80